MLRLGLGLSSHPPIAQKSGTDVPTKYLFIDAASLDARVKQISELYANGDALHLNWWQVAAGYQKVFFYDALPGQKRAEAPGEYEVRRNTAEERHRYLQTFDRFRVYQGDARWRSGRGHEQKKVDVMIAVDMMKHTIRRNMDEAALIASDVDFAPLLNALVDEGMFVTLIYSPGKTSQELLGAADARIGLTAAQLWEWLDQSSKEKMGFVGPVRTETRRSGPVIKSWSNESAGSVELIEKTPGMGGFSLGKFIMQWGNLDSPSVTAFEAASSELALTVGQQDFALVEDKTASV